MKFVSVDKEKDQVDVRVIEKDETDVTGIVIMFVVVRSTIVKLVC